MVRVLRKPRCITACRYGDVQDKSDAYAALKDVDVDDYLVDLFAKSELEPQCDCQE